MTAKIYNFEEWRKKLRPNTEWKQALDATARHHPESFLDPTPAYIKCIWCHNRGRKEDFVVVFKDVQYCSWDCWSLDNPKRTS